MLDGFNNFKFQTVDLPVYEIENEIRRRNNYFVRSLLL